MVLAPQVLPLHQIFGAPDCSGKANCTDCFRPPRYGTYPASLSGLWSEITLHGPNFRKRRANMRKKIEAGGIMRVRRVLTPHVAAGLVCFFLAGGIPAQAWG